MDWVDTAPIVTLVADNVIIARDERLSSPVYELIGIYSLKQDGDPFRGPERESSAWITAVGRSHW